MLPVIITPKGTLQRVSARSVSQTSFVDVGYDADKNQLVRHVTDVGNPNSQRWGVAATKKNVQDKKTHGLHLVYHTWMGQATKPCFFPTEEMMTCFCSKLDLE